MVDLAFQGLVVPSDVEGQHHSVVLNVFLEPIVRVASAQFHFKILFIFLSIRRVNFQILLSFIHLKIVDGKGLRGSEGTFHVLVEGAGKVVTVIDAENALEEVDVHLGAEILPLEVLSAAHFLGDALAVNEDALGNAGVFLSRFGEMDRAVVQVIVQYTGSDTVVF